MRLVSLFPVLPSLALLFAANARAQSLPRSVGDVELDKAPADVRSRLGPPTRDEASLGLRFWDYPRRGITVIWREGERQVHGVIVSRAAGGNIGGVKVGDAESRLRAAWGTPTRVRQDGRFIDYVGDRWVLSAEMKDGQVVQMTLMRASAELQR